MDKIIIFATPVFLLCIALEWGWGRWLAKRGKGVDTYGFGDTVMSLTHGILNQITTAAGTFFTIGIYSVLVSTIALLPSAAWWSTWYGFLLALLIYDFCHYWQHRAEHEVALFWASHVVHHQSQYLNLSTALRQTTSAIVLEWVFFVPMAILGVPLEVFVVVALVDLLYQFWIHTQHIGKLGWFDRIFSSPSNHRVHHGINDLYLDRNYGGILIIWDRLFGTYQAECEPVIYGTRKPLQSWDPVWANLQIYWALAQDSWHTSRWLDKLRLWLKPPGWQPADLAQRQPHSPLKPEHIPRYNPALTPLQQIMATLQLGVITALAGFYLWQAQSYSTSSTLTWLACLMGLSWVQGGYIQNRFSLMVVLSAQALVGLVLWRLVFVAR